jgi:predicted Zn-ribbon and HTH transcriptional regulator
LPVPWTGLSNGWKMKNHIKWLCVFVLVAGLAGCESGGEVVQVKNTQGETLTDLDKVALAHLEQIKKEQKKAGKDNELQEVIATTPNYTVNEYLQIPSQCPEGRQQGLSRRRIRHPRYRGLRGAGPVAGKRPGQCRRLHFVPPDRPDQRRRQDHFRNRGADRPETGAGAVRPGCPRLGQRGRIQEQAVHGAGFGKEPRDLPPQRAGASPGRCLHGRRPRLRAGWQAGDDHPDRKPGHAEPAQDRHPRRSQRAC